MWLRLLAGVVSVTCLLACGGTSSAGRDAGEARDELSDAPESDPFGTDDAADVPDAARPADRDATVSHDATPPSDAAPPPDGRGADLLRFGVFGDVRPPYPDSTRNYPAAIIGQVMDSFRAEGAQFVVASGDYMFATSASSASAQVDLLLAAEARYGGTVYHALGNHECTGASASNCPLGNETPMMNAFRSRLAPGRAAPYFDWTVPTPLGDAHFIATAPNAWGPAQQAWLDAALTVRAAYTFVLAHEPPGERQAPGSAPIEAALATRVGGVSLRLYGHTHEYRRAAPNAIISGNAGAPLAPGGFYGFVMVEQRPSGDLAVTAYQLGSPPMVEDAFVLHPDGSAAPH